MDELTGVDWEAIEADVDEDGLVDSITQFLDGDGTTVGIGTRYARLEAIATTDDFVSIEGDPGGDGLVQIRVPWATLEDLVRRKQTGKIHAGEAG